MRKLKLYPGINKYFFTSERVKPIELCHKIGTAILNDPIFNKGLCYDQSERDRLGLRGLIPCTVRTIEEQEKVFMKNYNEGWEEIASKDLSTQLVEQGVTPGCIRQWYVLRNLLDRNEVLYYRLIRENFDSLIKIINTPTVGWVAQHFSLMYHRARGMYFSARDQGNMAAMVYNWPHSKVDLIVLTDGSNCWKDQGIGGMAVVQSKLDIYIAAGGFRPRNVLPAFLDVGTNNQQLLNSQDYIGLKQKRIPEEQFFQCLDELMQAVNLRWPNVMVQFEDFDTFYARQICERYRDSYLVFSDLQQGGTALLSGLFGSLRSLKEITKEKYVVYYNSGQYSDLNTELLYKCLIQFGLTQEEAKDRFYFVDEYGLITKARKQINNQWVKDFARQTFFMTRKEIELESHSIEEVIEKVGATVLIYTNYQKNMLNQNTVELICKNTENPLIFCVSRMKPDVTPLDIVQWSNGRAIYATRQLNDDVSFKGRQFRASQVKKSYLFPGVAMGQRLSNVQCLDDDILIQAALALTLLIPEKDLQNGACFPQFSNITDVTTQVATHVILKNYNLGLIMDRNLQRMCQKGFDAVESFVKLQVYDAEYSHMVYYDQK